jgi:hypothetical protein
LAALPERLMILEDALLPRSRGILGSLADLGKKRNPNRFDDLERQVRGLAESLNSTRDGINERMKNIVDQLSGDVKMLSTSLRARDALNILRDYDKKIMELGGKLLEASEPPYNDPDVWAAQYDEWKGALSGLDALVKRWDSAIRPCLDINAHDLEKRAPAPPQSEAMTHQNQTRQKTLWLARLNYLERRDDLFIYFSGKAGEMPR